MRRSNGNNGPQDLDQVMAGVVAALTKFEQAVTAAATVMQTGGTAAGATPFGGALQQVQSASNALQAVSTALPGGSGGGNVVGMGIPGIPGSGSVPIGAPSINMPTAAGLANAQLIPFGGGSAPGSGSPGGVIVPNMGMGSVMMHSAAEGASDFFRYQAQRTLTGGDDPMAAAGSYGRIGGAILGGLLGIPFGPAGVATGAAIGSGVVGSMAEWWAAPEAARQKANLGMAPFLGAYGGARGQSVWSDYYTGNHVPIHTDNPGTLDASRDTTISRFQNMANRLNNGYTDYLGQTHSPLPSELRIEVPDIGATFGQVAGGMFAGGMDPMGPGASVHDRYRTYDGFGGTTWQQDYGNANTAYRGGRTPSGGHGLIEGLVNHAIGAIKHDFVTRYDSEETMAETYTRRLGEIFGKTAPDVAKQISPIFGSLPDTGGNMADIVSRFGPENTLNYLRIQNEDHDPGIDPMALSRASAGMRGAGRRSRLGALQTRGSGAAMESAFGDQMGVIASLPGGTDSEAYAEAASHKRDAGRLAYDQGQIGEYDIPMSHIEGERARAAYMPFSPTNSISRELRSIGINRRREGSLRSYMAQRRSSGQLSEREELDLTQQIEGAETEVARGIGSLARGMEDYLPAMSVNRPAGFSRYDSNALAAMHLNLRGSPIRAYGSFNGSHKAMQENWQNGFGAGDTIPFARMGNLDNGGGNSGAAMGRLADSLDRLNSTLSQGGGGGGRSGSSMRPGEAGSGLAAWLQMHPNAVPSATTRFN